MIDYHDFSWPDMPIERRKKLRIGPYYINAVRCLSCDYVIRSRNSHDYVTCKCGKVSVDGGSMYLKRVGDYTSAEELSMQFNQLSADEA